MTHVNKGWEQSLMMSLFGAEASFDAGVVIGADKACSLVGYEFEPGWPDVITNDKGEVTGKEHGYTQEITQYGFEATYKETHAKPNSLAGLAALILGAISSTQDGAFTAYKHLITPVPIGTALPSMHVEHLKGGLQYKYTGVMGQSLKLLGEAGGYVNMEAALLGSGTRAVSATAFAAAITESWLKLSSMKIWVESGAEIDITAMASRVQGAENISSGTPDDMGTVLKNFDFTWNNNLTGQPGAGGDGVLQGIDYGRRAAEMKLGFLQTSGDELAYYTGQEVVAIELNLKGAQIDTASPGGEMYYGLDLIIPRCKIKAAPLPQGGVDDDLTQEYDVEIFDDGTNSPVEIIVYNAQAAYMS